jgi:methionine sulfoxide reductase heme-binding subunit
MQQAKSGFNAWWLWSVVVIPIAVATTATLWYVQGYEDVRAALKLTARTSFLLFMVAFSASSLHRLWPSRLTAWLLVNRLYIGLAFAASHAIHLAVIILYWDQGIGAFVNSQPFVGFVANVIGYLVIGAMAVTSFKTPARWIGPRGWRMLHRYGAYFIWLDFAKSFIPRAFIMPEYWVFVAILVAGVALRLAAARRERQLQQA